MQVEKRLKFSYVLMGIVVFSCGKPAVNSSPDTVIVTKTDTLVRNTIITQTVQMSLPQLLANIHDIVQKPIDFAGEPLPLNEIERERLERELITQANMHAAMTLAVKRSGRWKGVIEKILANEGVHKDFFYLAVAESNLDEMAVSSVGAKGIWQIMKNTATELNLEVTEHIDERRDVWLSTKAACHYLKKNKDKFGNWTSAAAAYNRGTAGYANALANQKQQNYYELYLNNETYRYVLRIIAIKIIFENADKFGYNISDEYLFKPLKYREVAVNEDINDLVQWAIDQNTTYKMLFLYNPWLDSSEYKLLVSKGKTYQLKIPIISK
jgi:hypothetical protein